MTSHIEQDDTSMPTPHHPHAFPDAARRSVYEVISARRDVRAEFLPTPVDDDLLGRVLVAAHHAPSVGFMQPWRFVIVRNTKTRHAVAEIFERENARAARGYHSEKAQEYRALKLAGLVEAPVHIAVACDDATSRGSGLGRQTMPETALASTVCAVQNLWLAARAEGLGVGWISILDPEQTADTLALPAHMKLVAYLCVGHVRRFASTPDLERAGWEARADVSEFIHFESYGKVDPERARRMVDS